MPPKVKKPRQQPKRKCKNDEMRDLYLRAKNSISASPEPPTSKKAKLEED